MKISLALQKIIYTLFLLFFIFVFLLEVPFHNSNEQYSTYEGMYSNVILFIIGTIFLISIGIILLNKREIIESFLEKRTKLLLCFFSALFLFLSIFLVYKASFFAGWDAGTIYDEALNVSKGVSGGDKSGYYSIYPNNVLLTWVFSILESLYYTITGHYSPFVLSSVQCLLASITGLLLFIDARKMKFSYLMSWGILLIYTFFVQFSPWMIVPYSDGFTLIFPTMILYLYLNSVEDKDYKKKLVIWLCIGLLTGIGYSIKPQAAFITIALIIVELIYSTNLKKIFSFFKKLIVVFAGIVSVLLLVSNLIKPSLGLDIDPEMRFGIPHFFMMGMNQETQGVYFHEDVIYSGSFTTIEERDKADISRAKERLNEMGIDGYLKLIIKKNIKNYSDGTFAWFIEGTFIRSELATGKTTELINSFIRPDGKNFKLFVSSKQIVWLLLLLGCAVINIGNYKNRLADHHKTLLVMELSLLGLSLFEMIFEARARYLFIYAPFYVLLGVLGLKNLFMKVSYLKRKLK